MATATKQARSTRQRDDHLVDGTPSAFRVFQNNGGDYHWTIVSADGTTLAQSGSFASLDDAEHAALRVRDGVASVPVERGGEDARALAGA